MLHKSRVTMISLFLGLGVAVVLFLTGASPASAAEPLPAVPFSAAYGGTGSDQANAIVQTADGGHIMAGNTASSGAGGQDAWVTKIMADGTVAWSKTFGGAEEDGARAIIPAAGGGYILAGYTGSFGAGLNDVWVIKLDASGSVTWQKTYGGTADDEAFAIQPAGEGYVVAGYTESSGAGQTDAWVLRLDANGGVIWLKTYGDTGLEEARAIRATSDGGFVVATVASSFGPVLAEPWILKLNSDGTIAWNKSYSDTPLDVATDIQQTADGGFVVSGYAGIFLGPGVPDAWVLKLNVGGNVDWRKSFTDLGQALAIQQVADGGYVVAGFSGLAEVAANDAWLLKLIGDGDVAWSKTYSGSDYDRIDAIRQTADGGYVAAGRTRSAGAGGEDAWVLKLGGEGQVYGNCDLCESTGVVAADSSVSLATETVVPADSGVTPASSSASIKNPAVALGYICTPSPSPALAATYGGAAYEEFFDVEETAEGGYVLAGVTRSSGAGGSDAWIVLLDANLQVVWQKTHGWTEHETAQSIVQSKDGGFMVAGWTESFGAGGRDLWLLELTAGGDYEGNRTIGSVNYDLVSDIQRTKGTGYVVAGATVVNPGFGADLWVLELDSSGAPTWSEEYAANKYEEAYSVQQTADGGFIVGGVTQSHGAGGSDAWVLKLDEAGAVEWQNTYGKTSHDEALSVRQTGDGGYIVAGYTRSFGAGGRDAWVLKLDPDGSVAWQKTYGGTDFESINSIRQTGDGGYIAAGTTNSFGAGNTDALVLKLDADGSVSWLRTYGGAGEDLAYSIQQTADGGYVLAGRTESFGSDTSEAWVIKLDPDGTLCPTCTLGQPATPTTASGSAQVLSEELDARDPALTSVILNLTTKDTVVEPDPTCACGLSLSKTVVPDADVAHQGLVTYTMVLSNGSGFDLDQVLVTDTLPAGIAFQRWVVQPVGALEAGGELTWQGALGAGQSVPFVFRARHVGDHEDVIVNTAQFDCVAMSGSAGATLTVEAPDIQPPPESGHKVFLPLVLNNR